MEGGGGSLACSPKGKRHEGNCEPCIEETSTPHEHHFPSQIGVKTLAILRLRASPHFIEHAGEVFWHMSEQLNSSCPIAFLECRTKLF